MTYGPIFTQALREQYEALARHARTLAGLSTLDPNRPIDYRVLDQVGAAAEIVMGAVSLLKSVASFHESMSEDAA